MAQGAALFLLLFLVSGCGKKHTQARNVPPPPQVQNGNSVARNSAPTQPYYSDNRKPLFTQTGLASWYGPPYHNRKAADGQPFDMYALTAAHRTLPLNSVVRVTNLANGKTVVVRINDRGPFYGERILDLSMAAAKEIGTYMAGVAKVRVDVLQTPAPLETGGRWAVQIGAFTDEDAAAKLKQSLQRKYHTANVIQFHGPTGEWLRIRPMNDDRAKALEVAQTTHASEGGVFLVRLD